MTKEKKEIPKSLYVFIDPETYHAHWNLKITKSIFSSGYPYIPDNKEYLLRYLNGTYPPYPINPDTQPDTDTPSPFLNNLFRRAQQHEFDFENDLERVRKTLFPSLPSRLTAIFAFGSYEDCQNVGNRYKWDLSTIKEFTLQRNILNKVAIANMNLISLVRPLYKKRIPNQAISDAIWGDYWSGSDKLQVDLLPFDAPIKEKIMEDLSEPCWEYIIEGRLQLVED